HHELERLLARERHLVRVVRFLIGCRLDAGLRAVAYSQRRDVPHAVVGDAEQGTVRSSNVAWLVAVVRVELFDNFADDFHEVVAGAVDRYLMHLSYLDDGSNISGVRRLRRRVSYAVC